jgi:uncharacterized protein (UPF0276 family)
MNWLEIEPLGIGMASDVSAFMPDFREFIENEESPINYLNYGAHYTQLERVKHYIDDLIQSDFDTVFHPINFNLATTEKEPQYVLDDIHKLLEYTKPKWMGQDIGLWTHNDQYLGAYLVPSILDEKGVEEVSKKISYLNEEFDIPFLIENPPVYFSLEKMHMLEFFHKVVKNTNCGLVLDVGHLIGYQQATGRSIDDMPIELYPFENVVEIHLAGLQFSQVGEDLNIIDQHAAPIHISCWNFLEEHIDKMVNLKGITLEQEYCETKVAQKSLKIAIEKFNYIFEKNKIGQ